MNTSEVLNKAADLIKERGWTAGEGWPIKSVPGPLCAEGGIMAAQGVNLGGTWLSALTTCPAYVAVKNYLELGDRPLFVWNDATGRTASEVIEVLRACAVIEAAHEEQDAAWETYAELVTA